jgi:hypothetical protein
MSFTWNGDLIIARVREAEMRGIEKTGDQIADTAQEIVAVATSRLQKSIMVQSLEETGSGVAMTVGSNEDDEGPVEYALEQEQGPDTDRNYTYRPYIRPAVDMDARNIGENIKEFLP